MAFSGSGEAPARATQVTKVWVLLASSVLLGRQTQAQVIAAQCLRDNMEKGEVNLEFY